jgi:hypothetical protein
VGRFGDKAGQEHGQRAGADVLQRDGPALGAGHRFFRQEQDIPIPKVGGGIGLDHQHDVIPFRDEMGLEGQTLIAPPLHLDGQLPPGIRLHNFWGHGRVNSFQNEQIC